MTLRVLDMYSSTFCVAVFHVPILSIHSYIGQGMKGGTKRQKYDRIMEKKMMTPVDELCKYTLNTNY